MGVSDRKRILKKKCIRRMNFVRGTLYEGFCRGEWGFCSKLSTMKYELTTLV